MPSSNLAVDSKLRGGDVAAHHADDIAPKEGQEIQSTVRDLGIEVDGAIEITEKFEI